MSCEYCYFHEIHYRSAHNGQQEVINKCKRYPKHEIIQTAEYHYCGEFKLHRMSAVKELDNDEKYFQKKAHDRSDEIAELKDKLKKLVIDRKKLKKKLKEIKSKKEIVCQT